MPYWADEEARLMPGFSFREGGLHDEAHAMVCPADCCSVADGIADCSCRLADCLAPQALVAQRSATFQANSSRGQICSGFEHISSVGAPAQGNHPLGRPLT
jgi:hypothetical protein